MRFRIDEIAKALGARFEGDASLTVTSAAEPASATPNDLALAMDPKYADGLQQGGARAAILWDGADWRGFGLEAALYVPRPRYAMATLTKTLDTGPEIGDGIHPSAVIDPSARLGAGASIGPFVVIGANTVIGDNARIAEHVSIGADCQIGESVLVHAGVRIAHRVRIGDGVILHQGCVLGADGFSFVTPEKSAVENIRETLGSDRGADAEQHWTRIHSLGGVEIGDDVEIGANATLDSGTIRATRVGRGTKIDNLVHLGHNVQVGEDCLLCGQVGVAGSSRIGNRVVLAGQVGVNDNIFVGDDVVAGGATKIFTNAPNGRVLLGYPAMKMDTHVEVYKALRRLPRLFREVREIQKAVSKAEEKD
ncbi:UDP-3-O-(3-hydroxymyristoyl)glucosamine N-acyltransferase [Qingshengfaniella alkalisoli]|uniref:UDP-3-O-acylglucosamine N-acyltransferase n=1 Tax=Qingshengfaniella alkalisoli TaxID=2599296 RepID=A0A5B8I6G0_9RHOB|nr:UDP-3-O-(3-hydroxymyristoyl)glucosamine N-acyltransferase [Qingshengfaniella alkalisoli]QDY68999.1 UDP-3-O-(3-hydroxymyristoyl)glucosamine N-acyltransferase [Qingshengfaniella alkalisoli]